MGELSDWIKKNARDGADISEAEAIIERTTIDNVNSKEKAIDFILKNDTLKKGLDSYVTKSITSHDERFKEEKLPEILKEEREKIKMELNPPKDEKDTKYEELAKKFAEIERKALEKDIALKITQKSAELGLTLDSDDIERYTSLGEKGLTYLEKDAERIKSLVDSGIDNGIKQRFGDNPQPTKKEPIDPKSLDDKIAEARQAGNSEAAMKLLLQKNQTQQ